MSSKRLTTADLAERWNITNETVITWHRTRGLPAHKVGRGYLFDPAAVDVWESQADEVVQPSQPVVETDWVAAQLAKFTPDDLRRAGEVLITLSSTLQTAGGR